MPKLSEKGTITGESLLTDEMHIVRGGVSYRAALAFLFNNSKSIIRRTVDDVELLIIRKDPATNQINGALYDGDFVFFVSRDSKLVIFGMAIGIVSVYPSDLRDATKFLNFYESKAAL